MSKTKTQTRRVQGFESIRDIGDDFVGQFDPKKTWTDTWNQILGVDSSQSTTNHSELSITDPFTGKKDVVFEASKHQTTQSHETKHIEKAHARAEAAINYHQDFLKSSERASKQETREVSERLQQIMVELQKLVNSSKVLQMEFAGVSVDQAPEQAGEYHLNFFDWLLLTIRSARQKVEDSGAWLVTSKKKGGGKGRWNNKQRQDWFANTSMSMNNESGGGYINQTG